MRRHIPKRDKEIALHMSLHHHLSDTKINNLLGIRPRTMRRVRKNYRETGSVVRTALCPGRPRELDGLEAKFLEGCVERQPDIMLSEL
ncbi:hypothetical protein C8Q75DRAFT_686486, partial [Abortiporus biennis]